MRFHSSVLMAVLLGAGLGGSVMAESAFVGPSGNEFDFSSLHIVSQAGDDTYHVQFIWPEISAADLAAQMAQTEKDTQYLCEIALKEINSAGGKPYRIIVTLADQPFEFAQAAPEITQVFESYLTAEMRCDWEAY